MKNSAGGFMSGFGGGGIPSLSTSSSAASRSGVSGDQTVNFRTGAFGSGAAQNWLPVIAVAAVVAFVIFKGKK